jgi:hypothetical protein
MTKKKMVPLGRLLLSGISGIEFHPEGALGFENVEKNFLPFSQASQKSTGIDARIISET